MKAFIKFSFILVIVLFFFSCKEKEPSLISPVVTPEKQVYYHSYPGGIGTERTCNGFAYVRYSDDKLPVLNDTIPVPDSIINISKKYIYSLMGESYYNEHLSYRSSSTFKEGSYSYIHGQRYQVSHYYHIIIKDFSTNLVVTTYHDSLGNVIANDNILNRLKNDTLGMPFRINDSMAVEIAMRNKLEPGYLPWLVSFQNTTGIHPYNWDIQNQTGLTTGHLMRIDAQNGNIVMDLSWRVIIDSTN